MSQNVYVNLKSLKTSVSGGRQTAFDKLSTAFGKYSKTGNDNNQVDKSTKYASRMDMLRVAVQDYLDPTAGMTDAQRERFIKKIYAKIQSGKKLTQDELACLRRYDPVTYMKVARIQAQREALEAQLKCCKSKEEAQELYTDAVSRIPEDDPARAELLAAYDDAYGSSKNRMTMEACRRRMRIGTNRLGQGSDTGVPALGRRCQTPVPKCGK